MRNRIARVGRRRRAAIVAAVAAGALVAPTAAGAYQVEINIRGAGQVTETTSANLVGGGCASAASTPTGVLGKTCFAGTPGGDYGWNWDVDYVATPSPGYSFVRWQPIAGSTKTGIICDRSTPAATTTTYTGATCKFRTPDNLQTEAVFQDTTAPAPPTVGAAPTGPVNGPVTFSLTAPNDPTFARLECSLSGPVSAAAQTCNGGSVTYNPSQSGTYTLWVRSEDFSSNRSGFVQRSFVVDKTPPETTLAPAVGPAPGTVVSSTSASFQFSSSEAGSFRCTLDGAPLTCASSPVQLSGLSEGPHIFKVAAVDGLGNLDSSPAERSWTVDTVAPETTIDPAVGPGEGATTASTDAIFRLRSSEPSQFRCSLDGQVPAPCEDPLVLSGLNGGSHVLKVWAEDTAGNTDAIPAERHWSVSTASGPVGPGDPGTPGPTAACETARQKLATAMQKLRKLKSIDAPARKLRKAKKRARSLRNVMRDACATA